jgi:hypothetical protein
VALEGMGLLPAVLNVITSMPTKIGGKQDARTTLAGRGRPAGNRGAF